VPVRTASLSSEVPHDDDRGKRAAAGWTLCITIATPPIAPPDWPPASGEEIASA
jgi:hypothetical protein